MCFSNPSSQTEILGWLSANQHILMLVLRKLHFCAGLQDISITRLECFMRQIKAHFLWLQLLAN